MEFVYRNREEILDALAEDETRAAPAELMVEQTLRSVGGYNQFAQISVDEKPRLQRAYTELLKRLRELLTRDAPCDTFKRESTETMRAHFFSLRSFLVGTSDAALLAR